MEESELIQAVRANDGKRIATELSRLREKGLEDLLQGLQQVSPMTQRNAILSAVHWNHVHAFQVLMENEELSNRVLEQKASNGENILICAVRANHGETVTALMSHLLHTRNKQGITREKDALALITETSPVEGMSAVMLAIKWGHASALLALLPSVLALSAPTAPLLKLTDLRSTEGESLLIAGVRSNQGYCSRLLLDALSKDRRQSDIAALFGDLSPAEGCSAVLCALKWNHVAVLDVLLERQEGIQAALTHQSRDGENSLVVAARANQGFAITELLHKLGAERETVVTTSGEKENSSDVEASNEGGLKRLFEETGIEGASAVLCAIKWGHCSALKALLNSRWGMDSLLHHRSTQGENAFLVGVRANQNQSLRLAVEALLKKEKEDGDGVAQLQRLLREPSEVEKAPALICAIKWNHGSALHNLLDAGGGVVLDALLEGTSAEGENVLIMAARHNHGQVLRIVFDAIREGREEGGKEDMKRLYQEVSPTEGANALICAMKWGHCSALRILLEGGEEQVVASCLLEARSALNESALQSAVRANQGVSITLVLNWLRQKRGNQGVSALFSLQSVMEGTGPVFSALKWNHCVSLNALLQCNEGIDSALHDLSGDKENALIVAARHNQGQALRILVQTLREKGFVSGVERLAQDLSPKEQQNAMECARKWNHTSALAALEELFPNTKQ